MGGGRKGVEAQVKVRVEVEVGRSVREGEIGGER